jgi:hypothetical protein
MKSQITANLLFSTVQSGLGRSGMRIRRSRRQLDLSSVGRSRPTLEALVDEVGYETEAAALRIVPA